MGFEHFSKDENHEEEGVAVFAFLAYGNHHLPLRNLSNVCVDLLRCLKR